MSNTVASLTQAASIVTCGDLRGAYPNIQAPVCSGQYSSCTFSNSLQGCCNSQGSCQFFTTCNGAYATQTCSSSSCLSCPTSVPYCIKYNFWESSSQVGYDGYSCAAFNAQQTIFGIATAIEGSIPTIISSSSAFSSSSPTSSPSITTTNSSSLSLLSSPSSLPSSPTVTHTATSVSSTSLPVTSSSMSSNTGKIIGGTVGGVFGLAVIGVGLWYLRKQIRDRSDSDGEDIPEVQQQQYHGHNSTTSPLLQGGSNLT